MSNQNKKIKTNLKTLLKRYSKSDVIRNLERNYSQETSISISTSNLYISKYLSNIKFSNEKLKSFRGSIKQGLYQPLIVRKNNNKYEIIVGRRLFFAAIKENIERINAIVYSFTDEETLLILAAHIREQKSYNVIEEAYICSYLKKDFHYKNKDLSILFNQSESQISNIIKLLALDKKVISLISNGDISYGHAKVISRLSKEKVNDIVDKIIKENLSVRDVERLVYKKKVDFNMVESNKSITLNFVSEKDKKKALKEINKLIEKNTIKCNKKTSR